MCVCMCVLHQLAYEYVWIYARVLNAMAKRIKKVFYGAKNWNLGVWVLKGLQTGNENV